MRSRFKGKICRARRTLGLPVIIQIVRGFMYFTLYLFSVVDDTYAGTGTGINTASYSANAVLSVPEPNALPLLAVVLAALVSCPSRAKARQKETMRHIPV